MSIKALRIIRIGLLLITAPVLLSVCSETKGKQDSRLSVRVTILPQAFFVEKIGGEKVTVEVVVPPGKDPHLFDLSARTVADIFKSDVYFAIGIPQETALLEKLKKIENSLRIVDISENIPRRMPDEPFFSGSVAAADGGEHADTHTWLSPRLVKLESEKIYQTLLEIDPQNAAYYENRFKKFSSEIDILDSEIRKKISGVTRKTLLVYHPAFGYFADEYGFKQVPVEIEGKDPSVRGLSMLIDMAKARNIRTLFVDPLIPQRKAQIIATSIGAKIVEIDPLAREWDRMLLDFAEKIRETEVP